MIPCKDEMSGFGKALSDGHIVTAVKNTAFYQVIFNKLMR